MPYKTLDDFDLTGQRVLVRVDINAPVKEGRVADDTRLQRIIPTLNEIIDRGGKPILLAHFGRPKGQPNPDMSLKIMAEPLANLSGRKVVFASDCIGAPAANAIQTSDDNAIILLENLRFHAGEEANDPDFAAKLAALGDLYVNDAFSAAHRAHASTEALARLLPACAGRLMHTELRALNSALSEPKRPVVAVVGGAKISTKLALIGNLIEKTDAIVIGGAMANTFLAAQGHDVGQSLYEPDMLDTARDIMARAKAQDTKLILPVDVVAADGFEAQSPHDVYAADACPAGRMILDLGPLSVAVIEDEFNAAQTILWNGPLGAFELQPFDAATNAAALIAAERAKAGAMVVAGGGDTVAALNVSGAGDDFTYISMAGGAFLEWLEGKTLPGVAALEMQAE